MIRAYPAADVLAAVATELARGGAPDRLLRTAAAGVANIAAAELRRRTNRVYGCRVALLVGTGNNGADALLAGIALRRLGVTVDAVLTGDRADEPGLQRLEGAGGRIHRTAIETAAIQAIVATVDLIIDGIAGENSTPGLQGRAAEIVTTLPQGVPVLAIDLPSGIDPDSGELPGLHVRADVTVSCAEHKPGVLLPPAAHTAVGRLHFVRVGLPLMSTHPAVRRWGPDEIATAWPVPDRAAHKYLRGVLGVVAGSDTYPGAAVLACMGAVEAAAGIIRFIGPPGVTNHVLTRVPESVPGIGQVQAWLLGSGVIDDPEQEVAIEHALASGQPCVVDAGALDSCVQRRFDGRRPTSSDAILLTPHAGELSRMLDIIGAPAARDDVESRPLHYGRVLAQAIDVTVLVKGPTTLIIPPHGTVASQAEAPPWLATAGAGDVLAGIAGALLSGGLSALDAGEIAAHIHGRAAARVHRHRRNGPLTASAVAAEVASTIGETLRSSYVGAPSP
ncbi:bifunctional ADP-dependent NAD(P)H-hydrate dehydratase/NAD(P)H-hydrate epimerase [Nocardia carnea]|uniref:bifunctional ADP-dependent NAD(P)H-hydrate dehydratase/NAD(P)H-hydrate epimerase n=1 Tax=Nocardia carnea TaxID=37328 RepID=UPI00245710DA|nr:bifunctional ADP-dependent NAD(P)H-hydrate dehydratase/NAD(P)H-hydrate epimerase [Nocardia carnea]